MTGICLVDTSIFVEILKVPGKSAQHDAIMDELEQKIRQKEKLFLPMATILETGNHIGQNGNGGARRACAELFVAQVQLALEGSSPFHPISFLKPDEMAQWLAKFPDHATTGSGLGDLTIVQDWERLCELNRGRRVYVWSLDEHLASYDRVAKL